MTEAHVLAGCPETGPDSEPRDACGRFARVCSERSCLAFRDSVSWRASETCVGTGLTERSKDGSFPLLFSLNGETLAGPERYQLKTRAGDHQQIQRAYVVMAPGVATQTLTGSVDTHVTVLRVQSNRLNRLSNVREIWDPPKGTPWSRTPQHPTVTIRSSLLSLVSWKKVQGSACEMKNDSILNASLRSSGQNVTVH